MYITEQEYKSLLGVSEAPTNFEQLSKKSSIIINSFCGNKIGDDISKLDENIANQVKLATAYQVQHIEENGEDANITSVGIGSFNYSLGGAQNNSINGISLSGMVAIILAPTGLLYSGVMVCE